MNLSCIKAIMKKDALSAIRNNLLLLALLGGVVFSAVYYILPSSVDETFNLAIYTGGSQLFSELEAEEEEGVLIEYFSTEKDVADAVEDGDYVAGIVLPENFDSQLIAGKKPEITLYFSTELPESMKTSIEYFIQLTVEYLVTGAEIEMNAEIVGEDMAGKHIPLREQSIPLYLVMALMMEMWTISTLLVEESAAGTLRAIFVTPATPSDVVISKGIIGIGYSIMVAVAILVLTRSIRGDILVLFLGVLLGAIMSVSLALFFGSLTEDITGSYIYVGMPFLVLMLPGLLILLPDVSLSIVKIIPTYYLVDGFNQILNAGAGLQEVWKNFVVIAISDLIFFIMGILALQRRSS